MSVELTKKEADTIGWYNVNALTWAEKHGLNDTTRYFQPEMNEFFRHLPQGRVLEIGAGYGGDATKLIEHYCLDNYVGIEPAKGLLEIARSRNPGATFKQLNAYDLDLTNGTFDGFWANAVLIHFPKASLRGVLNKICQLIRASGIGFISVMEGNKDFVNSRTGRYYSLWQCDEFIDELTKAGLMVIYKQKVETENSLSPWLTFIVEKNG